MSEYEKTWIDGKKDALRRRPRKGGEFKLNFTIIKGAEIDFGKTFTFSKRQIVIGRGPKVDISLTDEKVSRNHCQISVIGDDEIEQIMLLDLKSTNGTRINNDVVQQRMLKSGDRIEIGSTVIRFSFSDEIEDKYQSRLFNMANKDGLTGLFNKRYLLGELAYQYKIATRNLRPFCLLMIDIDDFKKVNDRFGHIIGDEYLRMLTQTIADMLRGQDIIGRFGGEEFLIISPETDLSGAYVLAERIRKKIAKTELAHGDHRVMATISIGIAQFGLHTDDHVELLKMADKALYQAKHEGKNVAKAVEIK